MYTVSLIYFERALYLENKLLSLSPIPKNKRGNKCNSNHENNILGKIFDIIVLDAQYDSLSTDILQVGFIKNSSTVI